MGLRVWEIEELGMTGLFELLVLFKFFGLNQKPNKLN